MNILVIGTGAIGSFYGAMLAKAGATVSFVARSDFDAIRAHGIDIQSEKYGNQQCKPFAVYRSAAEIKDKPDYVLLCVKLLDDTDLPALARGALGVETAIVLIANGVEIEESLARAYPRNELITALAFIAATRTAPGKIWHQNGGRLTLGSYPKGASDKARRLVNLLTASGVGGTLSEDMAGERWKKLVWNAPFNPLSVTLGGLTVDAILKSQEPLVRSVMEEVGQIAAAAGHSLPPGWVDDMIAFSWKMEPYKTSMLVDFEAGRRMEVETILGAPVRIAHRLGVAVPEMEKLYEQLKMREKSMKQGNT